MEALRMSASAQSWSPLTSRTRRVHDAHVDEEVRRQLGVGGPADAVGAVAGHSQVARDEAGIPPPTGRGLGDDVHDAHPGDGPRQLLRAIGVVGVDRRPVGQADDRDLRLGPHLLDEGLEFRIRMGRQRPKRQRDHSQAKQASQHDIPMIRLVWLQPNREAFEPPNAASIGHQRNSGGVALGKFPLPVQRGLHDELEVLMLGLPAL